MAARRRPLECQERRESGSIAGRQCGQVEVPAGSRAGSGELEECVEVLRHALAQLTAEFNAAGSHVDATLEFRDDVVGHEHLDARPPQADAVLDLRTQRQEQWPTSGLSAVKPSRGPAASQSIARNLLPAQGPTG